MKIKPVVKNVAPTAAAPGSFSLNTNEAPTKQEVIFELSKKLKVLKISIQGENSITPRTRNPSKKWRGKTHEKKLKDT